MRSVVMPVSGIAVIAGNNIRRLVRQPVMLFTTLALPFLVILVVGSALAGNHDTLAVGVVSHAHDDLATGLVADLRASNALSVRSYGSDASLELAVRRGQTDAGVIIPAGYGAALRAGRQTTVPFVHTPDQRRSASVRALVTGIVQAQTTLLQAGVFSHRHTGRPIGRESARATPLLRAIPLPTISEESLGSASTLELGFQYTAPSNLVLFVIITSLTGAAALIETRTRGITARLLVLPVGRATVVLGEFLGRFLVAVVQALVILFFSAVAFGVSWGNTPAVAAITLGVCLFGAALGMLVGFTARTMSQAIAFGPPLGIVLGMLGGCMWPLTIVPHSVRAIGHVSPTAWAMDAYVKVIDQAAGVREVALQIAVIGGFAAATLLLSGVAVRRGTMR